MKQLIVVPEGWPCKYKECPPGLFLFHDNLCFKSEYGNDGYVVESGEMFWGGAKTENDRSELIVQPCIYKWIEIEI